MLCGDQVARALTQPPPETFNTDYLQEGEAGFKIKKKKKRATRQKDDADDEVAAATNGMEVDTPAAPATLQHTNLDETNLVDDDDLQVSLARSRREASKKKIEEMKKRAAEQAAVNGANGGADGMDVDRVKREDDEDANGLPDEVDADGDDVLVLDDTSEFVRNIQLAAVRPAPKANGAVKAEPGVQSIAPVIKREEEHDEAVPLTEVGEDSAPPNARGGWGEPREEGEESDDDMAAPTDGSDSVMRSTSAQPADAHVKLEDEEIGGSSGQQLVSKGLASTLSLLRHQGLIVPRTPEELERDRVQKQREAWLAAQRKRDREREAEKMASRAAGSSKDQAQREYENRMREQRDAQATMDAFKDYKPNVNLTYHDEFGRDMTPKEVRDSVSRGQAVNEYLLPVFAHRLGSTLHTPSTARTVAARRWRSDWQKSLQSRRLVRWLQVTHRSTRPLHSPLEPSARAKRRWCCLSATKGECTRGELG